MVPLREIALPSNWETTSLGLICDLINGDRGKNYPGRKALARDGIPFVNAGDLEEGRISTARLGYISQETFDLLRSGKFVLGDILYCIRGSLGKAAFNHSLDTGAIASSLIIVRPNRALAPKYVFYYLLSPLAQGMIAKFDNGTAQPNLSGADLARFEVPIPDRTTQERIVVKLEELFSELDKGVESWVAAREQLKAYRRAVIKYAFEGKLTIDWRRENEASIESAAEIAARVRAECSSDDGFSEARINAPNTLADSCGWTIVTVGAVTADALIGLVRSSQKQNGAGNGVSYIKMDRLDMKGRVSVSATVFVDASSHEIEKYRVRKGDLLFNTRNSLELVGKTALVRSEPSSPTVFNNNLMRIRLIPSAVPAFINYQMCGPSFRSKMERVKKATTSVAAVYGKDLWQLPLVLPSLSEQAAIVRILDERLSVVDAQLADIENNLRRTDTLRRSILLKAFSGSLVRQGSSDESASALLDRIRSRQNAGASTRARKRREQEVA